MRILYAGSPDCSAELLKELHGLLEGSDNQLVAVLTNPPTAKGRHHDLTPTPTGLVAQELKLPMLTPERLDSSAREAVEAFAPDLLVCFAYGRIFGPKFMALFPKGGINFHPSLLPFYRGCAPVPAAIWNMEKETGFTVQRIAQKMDSGDILLQKKYTMTGRENADSLLHIAAKEGAPMLRDVILSIQKGCDKGIAQDDDKASYSKMLTKEDGEIDWNKSAAEIDAAIRACTPWPGAYTTVKGTVLKIIEASVYTGTTADLCPEAKASQAATASTGEAAPEEKSPCPGKVIGVDKKEGILFQTGNGLLAARTLQWQAKKAMAFKDFMNGCRNFTDCICEPKKSTSC